MNEIEDVLDSWFKKKFAEEDFRKKVLENNMEMLKEAFMAGYEQSILDKKMRSETLYRDSEKIKKIFEERNSCES